MKKAYIFSIYIVIAGFVLLCSVCKTECGETGNYVIIANKSVVGKEISKRELRRIFLGKRMKWNDDSFINICILKDSKTEKVFIREITRKSATQYRLYWRRMVFTGKGQIPKSFTSEKEVLNYVESTPGAVSYLSKQPEGSDVHVISLSD